MSFYCQNVVSNTFRHTYARVIAYIHKYGLRGLIKPAPHLRNNSYTRGNIFRVIYAQYIYIYTTEIKLRLRACVQVSSA